METLSDEGLKESVNSQLFLDDGRLIYKFDIRTSFDNFVAFLQERCQTLKISNSQSQSGC